MEISEENVLASINKLRLLAFELSEKAEKLSKESEKFSVEEKTKATRQVVEWMQEAESLNVRASELALQMVENTKSPVRNRRSSFMSSYLIAFFLYTLQLLFIFGNEMQDVAEYTF